MGKVIAEAAVSLDGFVADGADAAGPLFDWYNNGDVEVVSPDPDRVFHTSAATAEYLRSWENIGAAVIGRRLFDSPTVGVGGRRPVTPCSWLPTPRRPTGRIPTRRSRSSPTDCPARSPERVRTPATATSRSPAET
jgi:hypothetical protein